MKRKTLYIIGALVLVVIILFILKGTGVIGGKEGIKVSIDKAGYRDIIQTVSASGKIYPEVVVSISSDVSGEIVDLPVREGDSVTKGQVVAKIYADIYSSIKTRSAAAVNQTQAQLANAKASLGAFKATLDQQKAAFDRNQKLYNLKVISKQEFEQAESAYQQALSNYKAAEQQINGGKYALQASQADYQQAVENLTRTTIGAPMSGYVTYLPVKEGERVVGTAQMTGTEIMRVADMDTMEVQVDVGENDVPKVFIGDTAIIEVDAYNDRKFKGIVTQIASSSQDLASAGASAATSGSSASQITNYTVHIRILKSSYQDLIRPRHPEHFPFRPGMSANVDIQTERSHHVLAVPIAAVTTQRDTAKAGHKGPASDSAAVASDTASVSKDAATAGNAHMNNAPDVVVFVLQKDGTVKAVPVKTSIQDDNYIEITSGLNEGEQVVSAPYTAISQLLHSGSKVKVVPKDQLFQAK
ncbi:MAG TPA: efflux RND transporter periplasmic adaptor subunit [Chitinophagaceae bacterium]|jgi:HlyD family secretion protein|nr:efflux RND transporter periplasmic adaptor subunit [Chitinophagaceae bacterium]